MSVTWTQNGSGQYLVESKEHLLQIMNQGALYTNTGTPPTDYWASAYLQTSDIDLVNDHVSIQPIGITGDYFTGEYDGGLLQIKNWSYAGTEPNSALFGYCYNGGTLKHIRLSGTWTSSGSNTGGNSATAFLLGYGYNATVLDVEGNFDMGTIVSDATHVGVLVGRVSGCELNAITLRGTLNVDAPNSTSLGGIVGNAATTTLVQCRNLATFPGGIKGLTYVGGICGYTANAYGFSNCLNAMQGDIAGSSVGGICGFFKYGKVAYDSLVNSMVGNVSSSGAAGGIFGSMDVADDELYSCTKLLNYMKGNVVGSTGSGGIVGSMSRFNNTGDVSRLGDYQITKSVVAMQGTVDQSVRGSEGFAPLEIEVTVDTSFGMSYTSNDYGLATMVVDAALVYHPDFNHLPYFDMSGTDAEGNVYNWDFVFANIGGKFEEYTHLSVHKTEVSAPYRTDFGLTDSNTTVYLTYVNVDKKSVYIDSSLAISDTTASLVFDKATSAFVALAWPKNVDGKYLVESKQHLLQIMHKGALYTNTGTPPTDYWASAYLQTSDIDLKDDHANITPIGIYDGTDYFTGDYDGGLFQIRNWSYTTPGNWVGLFGYCHGSVLEHIRLSGVWTASGDVYVAFVAANVSSSQVYDIEADFDVGTTLNGTNYVGSLIGRIVHSKVHGLTLRGTVDITSSANPEVVGGVIGYVSSSTTEVTRVRNLATFPSGINAIYGGGITGFVHQVPVFTNCLNAMRGDITGTHCGGIVGYVRYPLATYTYDSLVNSMVGNIVGSFCAGGIFGYCPVTDTYSMSCSKLLNYMKGDVSGGTYPGAGIFGRMERSGVIGDISITKSVVAMQGTCGQSVIGTAVFTPSIIEVTVDTSFGMTHTSNDYGSATMVVDNALVYHPQFTDLPYVDTSGTDAEGNVYKWDFVFANVGGKEAYDEYTHLSVHKSDVSAPFYTDFGLGENNTVVYATYANTEENSLYIDSSLTVSDTTAPVVLDKATSAVVFFQWTKNGDDKYLVQSKHHLLQLMNQGSLYTDAGDAPTNYWASAYLQTSDTDLVDDHASIVPIGHSSTTNFSGEYDGGRFHIKNWAYTGTPEGSGLFGFCNFAVIKRIRLGGVWTLDSPTGGYSGFCCGAFIESTAYDIEGDFSEGTLLTGFQFTGALIGGMYKSFAYGVSVLGTVNFVVSNVGSQSGGVVGSTTLSTISQCKNLASFPDGICGTYVGGIVGYVNFATLSKCFNGMKGDLKGTDNTGGVVGSAHNTCSFDLLVNSMTGNINADTAGGIIGNTVSVDSTKSIIGTRLLNYMHGDIESSISTSGGIVGYTQGVQDQVDTLTKCVVAMQGSVEQAVRGGGSVTHSEIEVTVDTSFGMIFTSNDYGLATMVVDDALVYAPAFTDLPYIDMSGTDPDGNVYNWDFSFANMGGKAAFDKYTHLSVHKTEVSAPFYTDFGLADDNTVVYLTYANTEENSLYIDTNLTVSETTAPVVLDKATSVVVFFQWTKNGDDKYLVQSKHHLLQLMNQGSLYTDAGTPPTDYWASAYLQTIDTDLVDDHASIVPIGDGTTSFSGEYDGGRFHIKNWAYSVNLQFAGLFGYCSTAKLSRIRLSGIWSRSTFGERAGFLVGQCDGSTIRDIEGDFSEGTLFSAGLLGGVIFGIAKASEIDGVSVLGSVDFAVENSASGYQGGVGGMLQHSTLTRCRNLASFPNGINGNYVGGILGEAWSGNTLSSCLNGMDGDISGVYCGGIVGRCGVETHLDSLGNGMTGNITGSYSAGGIIGIAQNYSLGWLTATRLLNYMRGDIVAPNGAGGLLGKILRDSELEADTVIDKSVVAMQGNVDQSVRGIEDFTPSQMEVTVDTSFGMFSDMNDYGSATMVVDDALVYHPQFTDLPYVDMSGTDAEGNVYNWDFVFANVGGKAAFDEYTHLSVHKTEVSAPFRTDFGLGEDNTVVYATYANTEENSLYIDSSLTVSDTTAPVVLDKATSAVVFFQWSKNGDDRYLVQSKHHLLQLMNKGSLYTDAGTLPTDYWASAYLQTTDIDLKDDHASIVPIGNDTTQFTGEYDGGLFQIKNWSYSGTATLCGFFGRCDNGAALKHIRLSGVWTLSGGTYTGFLGGHILSSTMYDVQGDFDTGTVISGGLYTGGLVGELEGSSSYGILVKGTLEFAVKTTGYVGGVVGAISLSTCTLEQCRNLAFFPLGISGNNVGGIVGNSYDAGVLSRCLNAMRGDLIGTVVGGICGYVYSPRDTNPHELLVNSMVGNMSGIYYAGGVFGAVKLVNDANSVSFSMSSTRLLNYMKGDLEGPFGSGGIIGKIRTEDAKGDMTITKSVVAMQGTVDQSVRGSEEVAPSEIEVSVDTSFGMSYASNDYGSAIMVVDDAFVYHPQFTDLPYVDMSGTDADGNVYAWDFVFANVGGKEELDKYTHMSVHTAEVSAPYHTDFGLTEDNDVVYLTYANLEENSLYINSGLTISETTADIAFDYAKSAIVYGTPDPSETLAWTKNADGKFEVPSTQHLLQLMSEGTMYTDLGDHPKDYWSSAYLQTSDIDLVNDHVSIVPIGIFGNSFTGEYDGGCFQIKNWSFSGTSAYYSGLFGYCYSATLKHIRLAGVWTLPGNSQAGFAVGYLLDSTVYDIEGDFAEGTALTGGSGAWGSLFGWLTRGSLQGATVRGSVHFDTTTQGQKGGVVGYAQSTTSCSHLRNLATFPNGISGNYVGGILGDGRDLTLTNSQNSMTGDLVGTVAAGGIMGYASQGTILQSAANSSTGDITSVSFAGGIVGYAYTDGDYLFTATKLLNYMRGDVNGANGGGGILGGINNEKDSAMSVTQSIVAMQGSVSRSVVGFSSTTRIAEIEVAVDSSFGMSYTSNDYGYATTILVDEAFVYDPSFTDLPYIKLDGTDPEGNEYDWDFLFANMGGKFDHYTHLSVHTAEVSLPFYTDFGLGESNSVVYLTYANLEENSLYIDNSLTIVETAAEIAFDYAKSSIVYGTPDPLETLAWTKNVDGKFEVATVKHMLQLMSEGTMYTDLGDHPTNYWSSSYLQTSDIDLVDDHASIMPIGNDTTYFTGEYDGGLFQISNWAYTGSLDKIALFGRCDSPAVLTHIRLSGVWTLSGVSGVSRYMGCLGGYLAYTTVYDVEGDFDTGSVLSGSYIYTGGLIGYLLYGSCYGLTVRGTLDLEVKSTDSSAHVGGVLGTLAGLQGKFEQCRNLAYFPNGISGYDVGGIVGECSSAGLLSKCLNAMRGDLVGNRVGGICGFLGYPLTDGYDSLVNSMVGNIISSIGEAGGIFGQMHSNSSSFVSFSRLLNYMKGDIMGSTGSGGLIGSMTATSNVDDLHITKSVVAMQGNVEQSVRGSEDFTPSEIEVTVDTSFGMFFDMNDHGSATMVVDDALVYESGFTDLPYINLSGTDPDGNEYEWDFLYANIGGKYEEYTHLTVHTSPEILLPIPTTLGSIADDTVYLTYANVDEKSLYIDNSLTIVETAADVVFDHAKSVVVYGTPTPATTVLWTTDADGKFEVATKQHLLQLMNKGALYTDLGVVRPSTYWTHHYVQTAEIDLEGDITYFVCIGDEDTSFVGSFEHDGFEVLNWEHGDHSRLFGDRTTLMWTQNADGQYEVATVQHLLQIMERGERFVDEGDFPTGNHWEASASYIQTADIDLIDWHAKIHPIGNATTNFFGQYDGGGHSISNWSYTQPENSAAVSATGLFGAVTNAEIKCVRLDGVWTLNGSAHASTYLGDGFLCGSATASTVYDVESKFSVGTMMAGGSSTTAPLTHRVGCLIGLASDSVVCNVTLGGTVDMKDFGAEGNTYVGGMIGYVLNAGSSVTLCRNVAIFPNGITGNTTGGLVSYFHMGSLNQCINAMQGDVVGITHAGGVCGMHVAGGSCEGLANSMTGNIQATENSGGIHGCIFASLASMTVSSSQLMNYMSGNVVGTNAGGVVGLVTRSVETGDVNITNSIVAMNGTVDQPIHGSENFVPSALDAVVNTDFGMVYQKQIVAERTLTDFTTNPAFADLPYIPLVAADPDGLTQNFDFVFANLGGNFVYAGLFTHLAMHTSTVSAPFATDYGLDSSNTQVYLTYANLGAGQIFVDDALTIVETAAEVAFNHAKSVVLLGSALLPLICEPRALTIRASIDAAGSQFQITYQATTQGSREIVAYDKFSDSTKVITGLSPETTYVIRLYVNEVLAEHVLVTTAVNSVENYVVSDFFDVEEELYDISSVGDKVSGVVVNELFTTGDVVEVDMAFARKTTMETTFVKKGELVEVERSGAILVPFDLSATETQESTIKLSDSTSVQVGLEIGTGEIIVGGTKYSSGKSFILDGRKCTAFDI